MDRATVAALIRRRAADYGLDPETMVRIGQIESGLRPHARNPNSSAAGVFQFINSTGRQYGLANPLDAEQNTDAAMRFTRDNVSRLSRALGRDPTPGETYLAHQQGAGGAVRLLSNPDAPAESIVGAQAVRLNGGRPGMTAGEFAQLWDRRIAGAGAGSLSTATPAPPADPAAAAVSLGDLVARQPAPALPVGADPGTLAMALFQQGDERKRRAALEHEAEKRRKAALYSYNPFM